MVEKRNCSFCGNPIEPGTGKMYIRKDGTIYSFCSNKCKKNRIDLGRVPRRTRWTVRYSELKASSLKRKKGAAEPEEEEEETKPKKRPVKGKPLPADAGKKPVRPVRKSASKPPVEKTSPTPKEEAKPAPVKDADADKA